MGKRRYKVKVDWTRWRVEDAALVCERCGGAHEMRLPADTRAVVRAPDGFNLLHAGCAAPPTPEADPQ